MLATRFIPAIARSPANHEASGVHLTRTVARMAVNPPDGRLEVGDCCLPHNQSIANTNAVTQVLSRL